ncbi:Na+/H+ antiporter family protein [Thalassobacillus pellis]|uniref:Na+/H+ antiporter family protein n=1 Tax=Thalassobacillus pellis TaxID=748008 RepID=UPI001960458A|nr:Na+/H+ antiporter family protein [Thalassobacillus pellis]MBM7553710.1 putative histidine transporter YuiF (NhaC family) [Thalassobacillus pellis]
MASAAIISVLVMTILSLLRVNVIIAIIAASLVAGVMSGMSLQESLSMMISGMGDQASVALSYILLGAFAVAISYTGITAILVNYLLRVLKDKRTIILLVIAGVASLSQNLIPVHIAFIPILIPPLLHLFDQMKLDRRGVAAALTFGLKAPYVMIPAGFGLIFHQTIQDSMRSSNVNVDISTIALSLLLPGIGMILGLLFAVFISYRRERDVPYKEETTSEMFSDPGLEKATFNKKHWLTLLSVAAALGVQLWTESLVLGALTGLVLMFVLLVVPYRSGDRVVTEGIGMMGMIAFVMLIAAGYANVLQETGSIDSLVDSSSGMIGDNQGVIAFILLLVGLLVTMGIGSSFGTVPILAALFVPICTAAGFSPMAMAALIGTAGALGDAGSPASDSTLGPTSGLNADGKHNHIWDTCVPTFLHYNIPLFIFGWIAAMVL